ncbi:MAG: GWxTD domain-containing protein [Ignavibacteria bacterium]|nr:GWxTD domain-containing protein [Ignavibacteria bacterium]
MNRFLLALLFSSSLTVIFPQKINFEFDYAQFGYDSSANYVEFYYSFDQSSLEYVDTDTTDYVGGILHIEIIDSATSETIIDKHWIVNSEISDSTELTRNLIGILGFIINQGSYRATITGSDANNPSNNRTISELLFVVPFTKTSISLSDIQLASNIIPGSENTSSIFYKNTYEITPLPAALCGENQPILFYYTEVYNIQFSPYENELRLDELVVNSRGQLVSSKSKRINKSVDSRVEVGKLNVYKFPTETYTLILNLIDSVANYGVSSSKKFFVYNPSVVPIDTLQLTTSPVLSTTFGSMSEEELDDLYSKSEYIASEQEKDRYEALSTVEAKREFMYTFWKARDENPSDERNQYFLDYLKRITESNDKYSAAKKSGWKTDRGRVYLVYGPPSEIERYPNQIESKPYEIWIYESLEGGVVFVFGDVSGYNDYQLLHSTKRGELRDDSWIRRIAVQ